MKTLQNATPATWEDSPTLHSAPSRSMPRKPGPLARRLGLEDLLAAANQGHCILESVLRPLLTASEWRDYRDRVHSEPPMSKEHRASYEASLSRYLELLLEGDRMSNLAEAAYRRGRPMKFTRRPPRMTSNSPDAIYEHALEILAEVMEGEPGVVAAFDRGVGFGERNKLDGVSLDRDGMPRLLWSKSRFRTSQRTFSEQQAQSARLDAARRSLEALQRQAFEPPKRR